MATYSDPHPSLAVHIKAFIDSRTKQGRPIKQSKIPDTAKQVASAHSKRKRPATTNAKTKKKELS